MSNEYIQKKNIEDGITLNLKTSNDINKAKGMVTMKKIVYNIDKNEYFHFR